MLRANVSWSVPEPSDAPTLVDAVLESRGLTLKDLDQDPPDPFLLPDMEVATDVILDAITKNQSIYVFGDYDVDGMTAGAGLVRGLRRFGANAELYIPNRSEGFGLSIDVIEKIAAKGANLVITVDNGSDRADVVKRAHELGMRVIITDHHLINLRKMPKAEAVVNPGRSDSKYPFGGLCGSGIAYFVLEALSSKVLQRSTEAGSPTKIDVSDLVPLPALGTMADVVDILGPNRWLVRKGLQGISRIPGLKALLDLRGLRNPSARDVTFLIIPMLNAPGRLDSPEPSVELLLTDDPLRAQELANELQIANVTRQEIGARMLSLARKQVDDPRKFPDTLSSIFFWTQDNFKHGLVGILAGDLAETYGRPSFVGAAESGSPIIKGSARSGVFDMDGNVISVKEIMDRAAEIYEERYASMFPEYPTLFSTYGGHPAAAGFSIPVKLATVLRDCLDRAAQPLMENVPMGRLMRADVTWKLPTRDELESLSTLEPTGHGFEAPVLYVPNVEVSDVRYVPVPNQTFKARTIILRQGDRTMEAVCFKKGQRFEKGQRFDLLCAPHREGLQIQELKELMVDPPEKTPSVEDYDLDAILMG